MRIMPETTVRCHQLHKSFAGVSVVADVTFTVATGQILALLGPSGCGKTTTLRLIAGFEELDAGWIEIAGKTVADDHTHLPPEKRRVGMVFQDYAIFPHLNVADNVAFGLGRGQDKEERVEAMLDLVNLVGLGEQMPHELSGGQQQRVALARALAHEPAVLLLDEPFSNLDTALRLQVRAEVRTLLKRSQVTAIFVTHDQEEALFIGDQVAVMSEGQIEQIDTPEAVFQQPATRFVAEFMGHSDFVSGRVTDEGVLTALGPLAQRLPLEPDTEVDVLVRPDDVTVAPVNGRASERANGRVLLRQFVGIANIYHLLLDDGSRLRSREPHARIIDDGSRVEVSFTGDHPLPCFYRGKAIPSLS